MSHTVQLIFKSWKRLASIFLAKKYISQEAKSPKKRFSKKKLPNLGAREEKEKQKELNLESKVKFMGYTKYPKNYIAAADYFILPSRWEGLPNAVLESLVLGTPVLSFKEVEGLVDIIPNVEKNKLYLCKNENEMELLLKKLPIRDDNKNLTLRKNLLKKFNTPLNYSQIISKSIKEILL